MRQYRGLTKEGKWVYGWYFKSFTSGLSFIITDATNHPYRFTKTKDMFAKVIPETVGQSTGLKDKNGKEIYEGDKLDAYPHYNKRFIRTVIWNDELTQFQAVYSDGSGIQLFTKQQCLKYEVIGDIHTTLEQDNG
jgi:uncharacterized phage protein (TIGR01671 family)